MVREGQQVSGSPPGGPVGIRRPTHMDGRDRIALPEDQETFRGQPGGR